MDVGALEDDSNARWLDAVLQSCTYFVGQSLWILKALGEDFSYSREFAQPHNTLARWDVTDVTLHLERKQARLTIREKIKISDNDQAACSTSRTNTAF